jgi:hypothetical protein
MNAASFSAIFFEKGVPSKVSQIVLKVTCNI